MPAMSRFVLDDGAIDETPDALPFTRGASFLSTGIATLHKRIPAALSEVLKITLDILIEHKDTLIQKPTVYDICMLKEPTTVLEGSARLDNAVVAYNYGESSVKVRICC